MGKSRGGGSRLARVLALPATARDGWVGAGSGRSRRARRRWSRGRFPARTEGRGFCRLPPRGPVAPLELPRRSPVGGRRSRPGGRLPRAWSWRRDSSWDLGWRWSLWGLVSWGDTEGWESFAELPLWPWAGDGRCGTSNRLSASRGRRFETSRRSRSGGRALGWGPSQTLGSYPPRISALGASQPIGCSAQSRVPVYTRDFWIPPHSPPIPLFQHSEFRTLPRM